MRGVSATIVTTILLLLSITTVTIFYQQFGKIAESSKAKGQELLVDARFVPKFLGSSCSTTHGYLLLSTDEPLIGGIFYTIYDGLDEVTSGFTSVNITDVGKAYFNATLTEGSEYFVEFNSRYWSIKEKCEASSDPSLVMYLPFSEGSGTTAADSSTNENHAWVNASWVNGTTDYALRFDGLGQSAKSNYTTGFSSDKFTLAFWGMVEYVGSNQGAFVEGSSFYVRSLAGGDIRFGVNGGSSYDVTISNKTWVHFTMRYDGSDLSIYQNCS